MKSFLSCWHFDLKTIYNKGIFVDLAFSIRALSLRTLSAKRHFIQKVLQSMDIFSWHFFQRHNNNKIFPPSTVKNTQNLDHVVYGWPLLKCSLEDWSFFIGPAIAHWLHLQNIYKKLISRRNDIFSATIKPIFMNATQHRTSVVRVTESSFKRSPVFALKCCLHSYILVHQIW